MAAGSKGGCCSCCFSFIITSGLAALLLWLSLRIDEPKFYIESFYVPALNKALNSPSNATNSINFTLKLVNGNKDKGIRYDAVHLDMGIFVDSNTTRPIGNATIDGFYQGHQKKAHKPSSVEARGVVKRTAVNGRVHFRLNYTTAVKYKIMLWYTKGHRLWGGANVEVNDFGDKVSHESIRLGGNSPPRIESGAPKLRGRYCALLPFSVTMLLTVMTLLH